MADDSQASTLSRPKTWVEALKVLEDTEGWAPERLHLELHRLRERIGNRMCPRDSASVEATIREFERRRIIGIIRARNRDDNTLEYSAALGACFAFAASTTVAAIKDHSWSSWQHLSLIAATALGVAALVRRVRANRKATREREAKAGAADEFDKTISMFRAQKDDAHNYEETAEGSFVHVLGGAADMKELHDIHREISATRPSMPEGRMWPDVIKGIERKLDVYEGRKMDDTFRADYLETRALLEEWRQYVQPTAAARNA